MSIELVNITEDMSDWDKHWGAFRNTLNIFVQNKYYGISKEDLAVIGQESISDIARTIVDKVKAFFQWLWEKITDFFGKIKKFVLYIWNKIKEWLGFKNNDQRKFEQMCQSCTLSASPSGTIHYYYDTDTCNNIMNEYFNERFPVCRYHIIVGSTDNRVHKDYFNYAEFKEEIAKYVEKVKKLLDENGGGDLESEYLINSLAKVYNNHNRLVDHIAWSNGVIDKMRGDIKLYKDQNLNEDNILKKLLELSDRVIDTANNIFPDIDWWNSDLLESEGMKAYENATKTLENLLKFCMTTNENAANMYAVLGNLLMRLFRKYNIKEGAVNLKVELPRYLVEHIQKHYGEKFNVGYVFITSLNPRNWNDSGCYNGGTAYQYLNSTSSSIWLDSANLLRKNQASRNDYLTSFGIKKMLHSTAEGSLISSIVHEMTHNADWQTDKNFDRDSDYEDQEQEVRARKAEGSFEPTAQEMAWAKVIIDKIEEQASKHD